MGLGSIFTLLGRIFASAPLSLLFAGAGVQHFLDPDLFMTLMPGLPFPDLHLLAVYVSGVFEVVLGLALVIYPSPAVCSATIALVVAMTPANINM